MLRGIRPLFPKLLARVCLWVLPVVFDNCPGAHFRLRERGIPDVAWGGVRHSRLPRHVFQDADFLYDDIVFLPIHQCLEPKQILTIATAVKELLSA
jgi:hypothetical protein